MKFGSVCSGIEAASVAWPFWDAAWFSEIEPFPCAALAHHYPQVPNYGDMTLLPERILSGEVEAPDVFCGGTPCQAFSVAGNRQSLSDKRGNLSLTFCEIADAIDAVRYVRGSEPAIIFWENVPGVLNTTDNAFGCFLAKLAGEHCELQPPGGRWTDAGVVHGPKRSIAWRVLDAQFFGLAQRRKRVFVVSSAREGFNPAEVLFEFDGLRRDTAPSREAGQGTAADAQAGARGGVWPASLASTLNAAFGKVGAPEVDAYTCLPWPSPVCAEISPTVTNDPPFSRTGNGFGLELGYTLTKTDVHGVVIVAPPHAFKIRGGCEGGGKGYLGQDEQAFTITTGHDQQVAVPCAYPINTLTLGGRPDPVNDARMTLGVGDDGDPQFTLQAAHCHAVATQYAVRRLTPTECERLQGFSPVLEITRLIGCIDRQSKTVNVEIQCRKLQSSAWTAAESEYVQFANAADWSSNTSQASQGCHVALYAQSSFGALSQVLRKEPSEKSLCASNAEKQSWSRCHIQDASFAASLVPHLEKLAKEATNGKAESHQPTLLSLTDQHGNQNAAMFGGEITDIASDAKSDVSVEKFTISHLGRVTPTCDSPIAISLCSVIHATSSFIQSETPMENFCIDIVLERDYTNIPWRNKPEAPDGPRYKALGNSWAIPCVTWLGNRINQQLGQLNVQL